jgi:NAD(P)H dehydrogenase (quinone)
MILVTGATGNLGKAIIESILSRGIAASDITVLVRNENKAAKFISNGLHIKIGDYDDITSLTSAFHAIDTLVLVSSSSDINKRFDQHKNAIDAAKECGVSHIIYTGFDKKDLERSIMVNDVKYHLQTARYLKQIGIPYTIMDNTLYADMIPVLIGKNVDKDGVSFPAGDGKTPFLPIAEMAEAIAVVATTSGHENKEYTIAADTAFSFSEIAELLSEIKEKQIDYRQPEISEYVARLINAGITEDDAEYIARFGGAIANGEFDTKRSDFVQLLGRDPVRLKDFLKGIYTK